MIKAEVLLREARDGTTTEDVVEGSMSSNAFYLRLLVEDKEDLMKQLRKLNMEIRKLEESLRSGS